MAECAESQTTKDIMNCPICLERYTKPKYLPCLHTFCEDCILTYVTSILEKLDGKEHINCPVCRTTVQLPNKECTPKEFVDEIPANFLIIGLLEKEKITRLEKPCMSCERLDITSNASVICIDCSDTLCDTCQIYHRANKATYDHHIIPVSQLPDDNILPKAFKNICTKHSKKFKLFCSTHSVPCCLLCLTNDHRTCAGNNIIPVEEAAKIYCSSVKFDCLQIDLKNVSDDIDTLSHHFSQCFKDIETQYKCKLKSIENTCSSLIAKVKDLEITRKTELAKIFDERKDAVETQMIACENHRKSIDNQKQVIDTSIGKATYVQVMIEAEKIISQVEHHKRFLADSSSKHNFKYTITVDDGNDLAKSVEQFVDSMCSLSCDCVKVPLNVVTNLTDTNSSNAKLDFFRQSRSSDLPKSESSVVGSTTVSSSSDVKGGVFGAGATEFSFSSIIKDSETSSGGVFGGGGTFSFSDLAKQADSSTSPGFKVQDHTSQFSWAGAGQQLFSTGAGHDNEEGAEEADESCYTYDPQYEPIIDLPDLVDTKTGEEDYEKIFCQRAKLYRFHKENNQWKERGLGEMKILRHLVNSRYRLILRREQVLKLACNQWLTADISFKPLPTSETSWCWSGQDFSYNEPVIENLVIKFKTIELAQQFKQVIDTCQKDIRKQKSTATEKGDADIKPTTVIEHPEDFRNVVTQPKNSRTVVTQPADSRTDEEDDDEEYTTDEDEEEILFDKRIKFFSEEEDWKHVGFGTIKVIYDKDVNGNRIMVELDNKNVVCNHLVTKELNMAIYKKDCYWSPIDFSTDEPVKRHFRSQFSSEHAAQEFQKVFEEGRQLAQESEISERDIAAFPHEITFPHDHGGASQ